MPKVPKIDITDEDLFPVQPMRNALVVLRMEEERLVAIPDSAKARMATTYGEIIATGPGTISPFTGELLPTALEVGEHIMFGEYAGSPFKHDGVEYLLMEMADVGARYDPERFDPDTPLKDDGRVGLPTAKSPLIRP